MKTRVWFWMIVLTLVLALAACQTPAENTTAESPTQAYPAPGPSGDPINAYPVETFLPEEAAYPITEPDLKLLLRTWSLVNYSEDGINKDLQVKTLGFNADGSYEIITESGSTTGNWNANLLAFEPTLILDPDLEQPLTFEIVELNEAQLILQSWREDHQINEEYLPAD